MRQIVGNERVDAKQMMESSSAKYYRKQAHMRIGHPTVQKDEGALAIVCMAIGDMDEHNTDRVSDVPPHTKPRKRNLVGRR